MKNIKTELEEYIKQLESEIAGTTEVENAVLVEDQHKADILKSKILILREVVKELKSIAKLENKTYEDGIKEMEEKIVEKSKTGKPIAIDDRLYFIKDDIDHLREIMDKM